MQVHRLLSSVSHGDGERHAIGYSIAHHDVPEQARTKLPEQCFSYGSLIWLREAGSVPRFLARFRVGPIYVGKSPVIPGVKRYLEVTRAIAADATYLRTISISRRRKRGNGRNETRTGISGSRPRREEQYVQT